MKMHDCTRTKEQLIDLVFDEAPDAARLRAEVESCADCRAEHRALAETLRAYERATDVDQPSENFWAGYHARLAARLASSDLEADAASHGAPTSDPLDRPTAGLSSTPTGWLPPATDAAGRFTPTTSRLTSHAARLRRALSTTWLVPAPAAVAAALLVACVSVFALVRPAPAPVAVEPPARADLSAEIRTVEVPFVREKIVTRTVYVARGEGSRADRSTRALRIEEARNTESVRAGVDGVKPGAGADTLAGFRPAADAKLRVIKGSYANEK
jgi:hypothetical protein